MGGINGVFEESQVSLKRNYLLFHFINCLSFQESETDASECYVYFYSLWQWSEVLDLHISKRLS